VTVVAKSGQFIADDTGKGQFLQENRRNLAEEGVVRKISSPKSETGVPNLCNYGASGLGIWIKGSVAPVLASESTSSLPGSPV